MQHTNTEASRKLDNLQEWLRRGSVVRYKSSAKSIEVVTQAVVEQYQKETDRLRKEVIRRTNEERRFLARKASAGKAEQTPGKREVSSPKTTERVSRRLSRPARRSGVPKKHPSN
jgi:hypothetical protein